MFCANCGKQIKDGSKFCLYCGAAQGETPVPVTPATPAAAVPPRVPVSQPPVAVQQPAQLAPMPAAQPVAVMQKPKKKKPVAAIVAGVLVVVAALAGAGYFVVLPMVHRHQWQTGMQEAGQALAAQNYRSALRTLEEADDTLPDQPETKVQLARAYAGNGDFDKAEKYMEEISDAHIAAAPYTPEDEDAPHQFNIYDPVENLLEIGQSEVENGEKTLYNCYYSAPDENTQCLTWWKFTGDSKIRQAEIYFDPDWKLLKYVSYDDDGNVTSREERTYDEKNNLIRDVTYLPDGTINNDYQYTYDDNGNKASQESWYNSEDGSYNSHYLYTYNADGNPLTGIDYDRSGKVTNTYEYTYDADGNRLSYIEYDENGIMAYYNESTYDVNGNQVTYTAYRENGKQKWAYRYTYDDHNNKIKETTVNDNGTETVYKTYTYSYDDSGNILVQNIYYADSKETDRYEYTYDENGNQLSETRYNNDGSVAARFTYNSDGSPLKTEINDDHGNAQSTSTYTYESGYQVRYDYWNNDNETSTVQYYFIDPALLKATAVE